jgi:hypothetical protein
MWAWHLETVLEVLLFSQSGVFRGAEGDEKPVRYFRALNPESFIWV